MSTPDHDISSWTSQHRPLPAEPVRLRRRVRRQYRGSIFENLLRVPGGGRAAWIGSLNRYDLRPLILLGGSRRDSCLSAVKALS